MEHGFWKGYVVVSKDNPDFRISPVFDCKTPAIEHQKKINGTKIIKVKVIPFNWKGEKYHLTNGDPLFCCNFAINMLERFDGVWGTAMKNPHTPDGGTGDFP